MGWTFGWDRRSLLIEHVTNAWTDGARTTRCIRRYFSGNDLWTVWETTGPNVPDDSRRFIVLFKMRRVGGDWGYKDETESVGPVRLTCPPAFFDLVPDPGGHATKWRANVRAYHAARSRHVEVGDLIARPGAGAAPLEVVRTRPLLVYNPSTDQTYRLSRAAFARTVTIGRTNATQPGAEPRSAQHAAGFAGRSE